MQPVSLQSNANYSCTGAQPRPRSPPGLRLLHHLAELRGFQAPNDFDEIFDVEIEVPGQHDGVVPELVLQVTMGGLKQITLLGSREALTVGACWNFPGLDLHQSTSMVVPSTREMNASGWSTKHQMALLHRSKCFSHGLLCLRVFSPCHLNPRCSGSRAQNVEGDTDLGIPVAEDPGQVAPDKARVLDLQQLRPGGKLIPLQSSRTILTVCHEKASPRGRNLPKKRPRAFQKERFTKAQQEPEPQTPSRSKSWISGCLKISLRAKMAVTSERKQRAGTKPPFNFLSTAHKILSRRSPSNKV